MLHYTCSIYCDIHCNSFSGVEVKLMEIGNTQLKCNIVELHWSLF